jgi:glycosyltransferase involved in cell wall biosynthesis
MLLDHSFPPDIRVENEAIALLEAGHEVHLLCRNDLRGTVEVPAVLDKLVLHVKPRADDMPRWRRRLLNLPSYWFLNVYWLREIKVLHREHGGFDAIHVHDLPLVRTALWAARRGGPRVVADMHENYPMALPFYKLSKSLDWRRRFQFSSRRWRRYERKSLPTCTSVIAVVDEMKTRLVSVGVPADKITLVENYVDVDRFLSYPLDAGLRARFPRSSFVIGYAGVFGRTRGLDMAVRAMKTVVGELPDAIMVMVGEGPIKDELERLSVELGLAENILFEGRVPFDRVPSYVAASDVCILPLVKTVQTDAGLAHKIFQYMLLGKPVVASDCEATRRVLTDAGCGLLCPPGDSAAFGEALLQLRDPKLREELGENGRRAVLDRYNWASAAGRLTGLYDAIQRATDAREIPTRT